MRAAQQVSVGVVHDAMSAELFLYRSLLRTAAKYDASPDLKCLIGVLLE